MRKMKSPGCQQRSKLSLGTRAKTEFRNRQAKIANDQPIRAEERNSDPHCSRDTLSVCKGVATLANFGQLSSHRIRVNDFASNEGTFFRREYLINLGFWQVGQNPPTCGSPTGRQGDIHL